MTRLSWLGWKTYGAPEKQLPGKICTLHLNSTNQQFQWLKLRAQIQVADEKNTAVDAEMLLALWNDDKQLKMHVTHWGIGME